jgi:hypothetical protein
MLYQILSPDGFSIGYEAYQSKKKALAAFKEWRKRYEAQGYYCNARLKHIPLVDLADWCELVQVERAELGMR